MSQLIFGGNRRLPFFLEQTTLANVEKPKLYKLVRTWLLQLLDLATCRARLRRALSSRAPGRNVIKMF